jgi:hypothetical protein
VERNRRAVETEAGFLDEVERNRRAVETEAGFLDEVERNRRAVETEAGFLDEVERNRAAVARCAFIRGAHRGASSAAARALAVSHRPPGVVLRSHAPLPPPRQLDRDATELRDEDRRRVAAEHVAHGEM